MTIIIAILLFSLLVFVHELGHFLTAKACGVQVNEFSIFMGPAIFKKQVGETLYAIRCIPFGGYCAMEGEDGDSENPRAFGRAAWWKKLLILIAGAAMNLIMGILLLAVVFAPEKRYISPVISEIDPNSSVCVPGGLQPGDRILKVDGERVYMQQDFSMLLSLNPSDTHDLVVKRNGEKVRLDNFLMEKREFPNEDGTVSLRYGFSFTLEDSDFGSFLNHVWFTAVDTVRLVRLSLKMLFTGQAGIKDMTGPVGIVQQISLTAQQSPDTFSAVMNVLSFGAFIAINLAVMNMLPIPALDGGRVFCLLVTVLIEAITHKKVNPKYESYIRAAGMVLLLGLMAVVTFEDIFRIFRR